MDNNKIFLIAGEPSGDALGAKLIKALREESVTPIEFSGIGGPLMEAEGFESLIDMNELCVMGIWEVLSQLSRLHKLIHGVVEEIEKFDPAAVVTIDLPDFNFHVAARLKKRKKTNARIVHYVAPTVWAWRPGRAKKVSRFLDGMICLFPFEPEHFTKHNLESVFIGHPISQNNPEEADGIALREKYEIPQDAHVLGLFFGSRPRELKTLGTELTDAAYLLKERYPDLHLIVPTLAALQFDVMQILEDLDIPAYVISDPNVKWDAIAACDVALSVSGTMGLELAYAGLPHVIAYKMHPVSWMLVRILVKVKYAHLANILLNKDEAIIPEFLQGNFNALKIAKGLIKLFESEKLQKIQTNHAETIREMLGKGQLRSPSSKAAEFVLQIMTKL